MTEKKPEPTEHPQVTDELLKSLYETIEAQKTRIDALEQRENEREALLDKTFKEIQDNFEMLFKTLQTLKVTAQAEPTQQQNAGMRLTGHPALDGIIDLVGKAVSKAGQQPAAVSPTLSAEFAAMDEEIKLMSHQLVKLSFKNTLDQLKKAVPNLADTPKTEHVVQP